MTLEVKGSSSSGILICANGTSLSHVEEVAMSKRESHVEKEAFISKKVFDAFREEVREEFTGVPEEFTRIHQLVKKKFKKMIKAIEHSKRCTDLHPDKTNIEIDSQYLIPSELLQSINLNYNLSEKIVHHDDRITDEKLDDTNLSDSQFTIPDELLSSLNAYRRESITRHPLATCEEEQTDEHFNEKKSKSVVQDHCQLRIRQPSKFNEPPYTMKFDSAAVEDIYIPVNIMEKHHWVLAILSFSERCIFLYDSYESSGHYSVVLDVIDKLATIIPLCLQHCDFYVKKGIDDENHPRYKYKDSSDMFDVLFQESLPQEPSGSLDCGIYIVTYAECLSYGHKVLANEFDPNALRTRYAALLWEYGTRKQDANIHSDVDAPLRPAGLPGGLLYFGCSTISPSMLSEISQSSLCGNR
ncbi:hypothetical protein CQW23_26368 [Capsicum baccatum]|uniref:Ubiquitin-like protease family profile domain-containing protein n=1 Tax=Capsicum baccatum TaxID=33114 RepID=A0A2G2VNK7_CAPBA|nr:hypothetical protein CQW23_26368 [Capsicum baccatum]